MKVPDTLLSGNHAHIDEWRERESFRRTVERRPDLLDNYPLTEKQKKLVNELKKQHHPS